MNIIFMGTPDFAEGALKELIRAEQNIIMVVTQPDRAKGRGKDISMPPVKICAVEHGIEVFQPEKVKDPEAVKVIRDKKPDLIVVAAFGQILSKEILDIPKYGCVNIHASLLPEYRGAAPIQKCIMDGKKETGVTIMQMNEGLDTGDILMKRSIEIDDEETGGSLFEKLSRLGALMITEAIPLIEAGKLIPEKQDDTKSSYAGMLNKETGAIKFKNSAVELERLVRAMNPWPSAYTKFRNKTLKIWKASVVDDIETDDIYQTGTITNITKDDFTVKCGEKSLVIKELQLEGKKRMSAHDFMLGVRPEIGESLG
ncbi:MAG: methionyl-tRNA formyltransferase [Lachnospiraceae bacterium]|nr:methionyl-tRNA formyltransferase [Lachnospiraceae bacterium]